jgi:hypothetical protein
MNLLFLRHRYILVRTTLLIFLILIFLSLTAFAGDGLVGLERTGNRPAHHRWSRRGSSGSRVGVRGGKHSRLSIAVATTNELDPFVMLSEVELPLA